MAWHVPHLQQQPPQQQQQQLAKLGGDSRETSDSISDVSADSASHVRVDWKCQMRLVMSDQIRDARLD